MKLARLIAWLLPLFAAVAAFSSTSPAVKPPVLVRLVAPNYQSLESGSIDAQVTAIVTVNADGTVRSVKFTEAAANSRLADAVRTALPKWVFLPALRNGQPVAIEISIPFSFDLQSHELTVDLGHYAGQ